jgi:hypothetical protein
MVTVTNFARFNLSALPETERSVVTQVINTLNTDGKNALGKYNAAKLVGLKDTYVIRTSRGTRIVAEKDAESTGKLVVTDIYPNPTPGKKSNNKSVEGGR